MSLRPNDLHVIRVYKRLPPEPGGMEQHIAQLTAAQRALGVRVTEVYNRGEPAGEAVQLMRSIDLKTVKPAAFGDLMFYGAAVARSATICRDRPIRVVHAHGDWSSFVLARALAKTLRASAVAVSLHDRLRVGDRLIAAALSHCDPIFATGLTDVQRMSRLTGRKAIHLPSAPQDFFFEGPDTAGKKYDVVAVGSLVLRKRLPIIVECAALRPNLQFAIVGDGPERTAIQELIASRSLKNVHLLGSLTSTEVRSVLHASKLFLNTSSSEGSPTAALEAMACGLPVVLTPSNDYSSIVRSGENGQVTRGWDAQEIAGAIDMFMDHEDRRMTASVASRRIAEEHRWSRKAEIVTAAMLAAADRA